ncbi:immunity protein Imm33 domain-containing protein [Burkholderia gladioli]|uniref:immunity protein Imm33 domain-containing protein n=2 Tax=Burkholderia gladioli TaxID=28095 RepID=UPI003DA472B6
MMKEWNSGDLLELQQQTCERLGLPDCEPEEMVAVAISTLGKMPVYGTRISLPGGGNVSWFFHCGEYSEAADFYQPVHAEHLSELLPLVLQYLRLPPGSKFIVDSHGYEDIWLVQ